MRIAILALSGALLSGCSMIGGPGGLFSGSNDSGCYGCSGEFSGHSSTVQGHSSGQQHYSSNSSYAPSTHSTTHYAPSSSHTQYVPSNSHTLSHGTSYNVGSVHSGLNTSYNSPVVHTGTPTLRGQYKPQRLSLIHI